MHTEIQHAAPLSASEEAEGALWNPSGAVNWSVLFTPAFGSFVQMLNWSALGQADKAAGARRWFYASLAMLGADMLGAALTARLQESFNPLFWLGPLYFALWYICAGREQVLEVRARHGGRYAHKSWRNILCTALMAGVAYSAASALLTWLFVAVT